MEREFQKAFAQPSDIKHDRLVIDGEPRPKITLIIRHEKGKLQIEETEYTKEFLGTE